jgi:hypothetical protein
VLDVPGGDESLSSNSPLQYKTIFGHTFSVFIQYLPMIPIGLLSLITNERIDVLVPHT